MKSRPSVPELHVLKAELFKALGHPIRVRVLELLSTGEVAVAVLVAGTDAEPSTLSTHLAVMRRAGIVETRRDGTTIFYRLADPSLGQVMAAAREFLIGTLTKNTDLLAALEAEAARHG